jgi:hypothetical protein
MKYFNTLPKIVTSDYNNNTIVLTNLLARASLIDNYLDNPLMFYTYDIQEGDTPEIIAHKYYDDPYRYWIVLVSNQVLDPQWNWPLNSGVFNKYIVDKYSTINPYSDVHHYEKIITQFDVATKTTTKNTVVVDQAAYNLVNENTKTVSLRTGSVSITTSKRGVSFYDYEQELNETKRNIKLLNKNYMNSFESQFYKLMK